MIFQKSIQAYSAGNIAIHANICIMLGISWYMYFRTGVPFYQADKWIKYRRVALNPKQTNEPPFYQYIRWNSITVHTILGCEIHVYEKVGLRNVPAAPTNITMQCPKQHLLLSDKLWNLF